MHTSSFFPPRVELTGDPVIQHAAQLHLAVHLRSLVGNIITTLDIILILNGFYIPVQGGVSCLLPFCTLYHNMTMTASQLRVRSLVSYHTNVRAYSERDQPTCGLPTEGMKDSNSRFEARILARSVITIVDTRFEAILILLYDHAAAIP